MLATLLGASAASSQDPAEGALVYRLPTWVSDRDHSSLQFRVEHWGIMDIVGWFEDFEVAVFDEDHDLAGADFEVRVRPGSARMPNAEMARNMVAMFDPAFPEAVFRGTASEPAPDGEYRVAGELEMNGVALPMQLTMRVRGTTDAGWTIVGVTVTGELDRVSFGIGDLEAFSPSERLVVGRRVHITGNLRLDPPE